MIVDNGDNDQKLVSRICISFTLIHFRLVCICIVTTYIIVIGRIWHVHAPGVGPRLNVTVTSRSDLSATVMMRDLLGGDDGERGKHADLE